MTSEQGIRERLESLIQQIEDSDYEAAKNLCVYLLQDHLAPLLTLAFLASSYAMRPQTSRL